MGWAGVQPPPSLALPNFSIRQKLPLPLSAVLCDYVQQLSQWKTKNVADKLMIPMRMSLKAGAWINHNYGTVFGNSGYKHDGYLVQSVLGANSYASIL
jgi:hypothetical protein